MNTKKYSQVLRKVIDFQDYANLTYALGTQLNERKDRFDKSDLIEHCIEIYSNGYLKYVDDIGIDHIDIKNKFDIEFKYVANGIFTKKKKQPKTEVKVKLKNSLGSHKGTNISNPADFYMIAQQDSIAIISWKEIKDYLVAVPDGIEAHIPFESLSFIFKPEDVSVNNSIKVDYKEHKKALQMRFIEKVRKKRR